MPYLIVTFLSALGTSYAYNEKGIIHAEDIELMYTSDSSLGRLDVVDINENIRVLSNNLTFQSICSKPDNTSIMAYTIHVISTITSLRSLDTRNSVAIVGLAADHWLENLRIWAIKKLMLSILMQEHKMFLIHISE
ncbi:MAG: hypothetical protein IPG00_09295 [Saprospiraceae bacterium]|nr:hypothetical protein [Saprospiraceae bacterium]